MYQNDCTAFNFAKYIILCNLHLLFYLMQSFQHLLVNFAQYLTFSDLSSVSTAAVTPIFNLCELLILIFSNFTTLSCKSWFFYALREFQLFFLFLFNILFICFTCSLQTFAYFLFSFWITHFVLLFTLLLKCVLLKNFPAYTPICCRTFWLGKFFLFSFCLFVSIDYYILYFFCCLTFYVFVFASPCNLVIIQVNKTCAARKCQARGGTLFQGLVMMLMEMRRDFFLFEALT